MARITDADVREALSDVIRAWEVLPGGQCQSADDVSYWLRNSMKPAVDKARRCLGLRIPTRAGESSFDAKDH